MLCLFFRLLRAGLGQLHVVEGVLRVVEDDLHLGKGVLQAGKAGGKIGGQGGGNIALAGLNGLFKGLQCAAPHREREGCAGMKILALG